MRRTQSMWIACAIATIAAAGCGEDATPPLFGPNPGLQGRHLLAFASDRGQAPGMTDLYLYDVDAPGIIGLTGLNRTSSAEHDPALAFDGNRVFFSAVRGAPGDADVYAYDVIDRVLLALPHVNSTLPETDPAPSADGRHLAFVRWAAGLRHIVMAQGWPVDSTIALPGLDSSSAGSDFAPACDSTGRRIAFTSDRNGNPDVFVWDRDSARVLTLPALVSPDDDLEPSITPSGRFVAFASNRPHANDGYRIYLYDLEARTFVALPNLDSDGDDRHPSVSDDAQRIAFQSSRMFGTSKWDLWIYERAQSRSRSSPPLGSPADDVEPALRYR